jgi:hypothetical protein
MLHSPLGEKFIAEGRPDGLIMAKAVTCISLL